MDKLKMMSRDVVGANVQKIAALFPQCVTERKGKNGKTELAIDFDKLRAELSSEVLDEGEERYQFTWPDKRAASRLANTPTTLTLRPCREESVDFDTTQNLYIEGDNLDVLKVLRETYLGAVKMIYIDPPYNTGNDFVYNDDFAQDKDDFEAQNGTLDDEGNLTVDPMQRNTESNGRFHTDWLNMIYPRIKVAFDLLSKNGALFISIDDHEIENVKKICNELFGEKNFVACVIWQRTYAPISLKKYFSENHDFCLIYAKNLEYFDMHLLPRSEKQNKDYKNPDNDPRGPWKVGNLTVGPAVEKQIYPIVGPTGRTFLPPSGYCWRFSKEKFELMVKDNRIWFGADGNNSPVPKLFLSEVQDGVTPMTVWTFEEVGHGQEATRELRDLMDAAVFTSPKPIRYITRFLQIGSNKDSIILDFFSGSATTAHAVMKLNAEDGGHRKFIMVQLPEVTDAKSEARKAGYNTICEIGKERIRRAGAKIRHDIKFEMEMLRGDVEAYNMNAEQKSIFAPATQTNLFNENIQKSVVAAEKFHSLESKLSKLDTGFRVLKLDTSNMEDVYYTPDNFDAKNLFALADNIKPDRSGEDLLFQVMLDLGILLSAKIEKTEIAGKEVWSVDGGYLMACFDRDVNEITITEIAKRKPTYFVMRDASAATDNVLDNFDQLFANYSPDTICKIL